MLTYMVVKDLGGKELEEEMEEEMELKARLSRTHPHFLLKHQSLSGKHHLVLKEPLTASFVIYWHGHPVFSMGIWSPSLLPLALYLSAEPAEGRG